MAEIRLLYMPNCLSYMLFHMLFGYGGIFEKQRRKKIQTMGRADQNISPQMSPAPKSQIEAKKAGFEGLGEFRIIS
jgi:hypothetical protein